MIEQNKHISNKKTLFRRWVRYGWILRNLLFFLFLSLLAVIYIGNGHITDNTIRDINTITMQVKELQYEYKSLKSEVMFKSREGQVVKAATPLGLKISSEPPKRLLLEDKDYRMKGKSGGL